MWVVSKPLDKITFLVGYSYLPKSISQHIINVQPFEHMLYALNLLENFHLVEFISPFTSFLSDLNKT